MLVLDTHLELVEHGRVTEPHRLDELLVGVSFPSTDPVDRFLSCWQSWARPDGYTFELPAHWRVRVLVLHALGVTDDELSQCVRKAMTSEWLQPKGAFGYVVTLAFAVVAKTHGIAGEPYPSFFVGTPAERDDHAIDDPVAWLSLFSAAGGQVRNSQTGRVHRQGCRTLERANPRNFVAAPRVVPFVACGTCF